jgi:hypothetical protein
MIRADMNQGWGGTGQVNTTTPPCMHPSLSRGEWVNLAARVS